MADLKNRYPLSAADGTPIPLDIVRPHGTLTKTFATGASTAALTVPATVDIMSVTPTEDVLVTFAASAASAAALSDGVMAASSMICMKDVTSILTPPVDKKSYALRGVSAAGTAVVNFFENWTGTSLASQITRR